MKKSIILLIMLLNISVFSQFIKPKLEFYEDGWDFGTIREGITVEHTFEFANIGGDTLIITNVSSSCGCTAAITTKTKILPGEKGTIKVSFDSNGKSGLQNKFVYVFSNDPEKPQKQILVKGNIVKEVPKPENSEAPSIQFSRLEHDFGKVASGRVVETIFKFKNVGKNQLEITNVRTSCGCTAAEPSKKILAQNESAEIKIEFDTAGRQGVMERTVTVMSNDPEHALIVLKIKAEIINQ